MMFKMVMRSAVLVVVLLAGCGGGPGKSSNKPDLSGVLSPKGLSACVEFVSVGGGTVHVLAGSNVQAALETPCQVANGIANAAASSPKQEEAADIRGRLACRLIQKPYGADSEQVEKYYVYVDGNAVAGARAACAQIRGIAGRQPDISDYKSYV